MADNMTIGPALVIGGNKVEMTPKGKIQVTNSQGKVKTLSQDEFKKQLIQNKDKIESEQDFEFKKDNKNAKAAAGVAGLLAAAYVGLSVAVGKGKLTKAVAEAGKELGFMSKVKNVFVAIGESGVDLWKVITGKAAKLKDKITKKSNDKNQPNTIFSGEKTTNAVSDDLNARLTSKETTKIKNSTIAKMADEDAKAFEERVKNLDFYHKQTQKEYNNALGLKKGQKDNIEIVPRKYLKADGTVMTEKERKAFDAAQKVSEKAAESASKAETPKVEIKVDPKMKAKWEAFHPELKEKK